MLEGLRAEAFSSPRLRRFWFVFPLAVLLLSYADYLRRGHEVYRPVATNLEVPRASSGQRVVSRTFQSEFLGCVYDVTVAIGTESGAGIWRVPRNSEMRLQLASDWKTRLLVIRPGHPAPATFWGVLSEVVKGDSHLLVVPHRGWIRLGPMPDGVAPLEVQIYGLLPGKFGFVRLPEPKTPDFRIFDISVVDEKVTGSVSGTIRYQLAVPAPVDAAEATKRFFFFASASKVLLGGLLVAVGLLFLGTFFLSRERVVPGFSALIASVTLLHAVCLPPLHGADETSHGAMVEKVVFTGRSTKFNEPYPKSFSIFAELLDQDRVQFNAEIPLPLQGDAARRKLRESLKESLAADAISAGPAAPAALIDESRNRAALFFGAFSFVPGEVRTLPILDRFSLYRLASTLLGVMAALAGVALLGKAGFSSQAIAVYSLVAILPVSVAVMASVSNYAMAVGMGALLAAAAVVALASQRGRWRVAGAAIVVLGSALGVGIWKDFASLCASSITVLTWAGLARLFARMPVLSRRVIAPWLLAVLPFVAATILIFPNLSQIRPEAIDRRLAGTYSVLANALSLPLLFALATPLLVVVGGLIVVELLEKPARFAWSGPFGPSGTLSVLLLLGVVASFLATPFFTIPYEFRGYELTEMLSSYARAFISNNLAWDQDRITWKFTVGTFGWLDTHYPDWVYATTRWFAVGFFAATPVLTRSFRATNPSLVRQFPLLSGLALSLGMSSAVVRIMAHQGQVMPSIRFVLPYVPLVLLPLFVQVEAPGRTRALAGLFLGLVAVDVWTAIAVLGARYYFGSPFPL